MLGVLATEFKVTVSTATGTQAVYYVCNIFLFFFFLLIWLLVLCQILLHEHPVLVPPTSLLSISLHSLSPIALLLRCQLQPSSRLLQNQPLAEPCTASHSSTVFAHPPSPPFASSFHKHRKKQPRFEPLAYPGSNRVCFHLSLI